MVREDNTRREQNRFPYVDEENRTMVVPGYDTLSVDYGVNPRGLVRRITMAISEMKRKRRRKPGDIAALRRSLWAALLTIEDCLDDPDIAVKLKAANALAQLSGPYLRALEQSDIEQRLAALESRLDSDTTISRSNGWKVYR
jgi:hypothetical protein